MTDIPKPPQDTVCSTHPDAPHGFDRDRSHNEDRYVCDCEGWSPPQTAAQAEPTDAQVSAYLDAQSAEIRRQIGPDRNWGPADVRLAVKVGLRAAQAGPPPQAAQPEAEREASKEGRIRGVLEGIAAFAESTIRTNSRGIDDWRDDVDDIARTARAALAAPAQPGAEREADLLLAIRQCLSQALQARWHESRSAVEDEFWLRFDTDRAALATPAQPEAPNWVDQNMTGNPALMQAMRNHAATSQPEAQELPAPFEKWWYEVAAHAPRGWKCSEDAAREVWGAAIARERERCARVVEEFPHWLGNTGRKEIAAAIRATPQEGSEK